MLLHGERSLAWVLVAWLLIPEWTAINSQLSPEEFHGHTVRGHFTFISISSSVPCKKADQILIRFLSDSDQALIKHFCTALVLRIYCICNGVEKRLIHE